MTEDEARLVRSILTNDIEAIKDLLSHNPGLANTQFDSGSTPLFDATRSDNPEIVELLLNYGAEVNVIDRDDYTPLFCAIDNRNPQIVELLLNYGANTNVAEPITGHTPLFCATFSLMNEEIARLLLKAGANPNVVDNLTGNTILHWAIMLNKPEIVELVLNAGADVNMKNNNSGETPLSFAIAISRNNPEIVKMLIEYRADVDMKNNNGSTPLFYAISFNNKIEIVKLLLDAGAKPNTVNLFGYNQEFIEASINNNPEVLKLFIDSVPFNDIILNTALFLCFDKLNDKDFINTIFKKFDIDKLDKILDFFDEKFEYSRIEKHDLLKMFFNNLNLDFPSIDECRNELIQSQNNTKVLREAMQDLDPDITKALLYEFDHNFYDVENLSREQLIYTFASSKLPQAITTVLQNTDQNIDPATSGILNNTELCSYVSSFFSPEDLRSIIGNYSTSAGEEETKDQESKTDTHSYTGPTISDNNTEHTTLDLAGNINDIDY